MTFLGRLLGRSEPAASFVERRKMTTPAVDIDQKQAEAKAVTSGLAQALVTFERKSVDLREELAGSVIRIVSGRGQ